MANKQLNVNLAFTADTKQAKVQLQELQNLLTKITQTSLRNSSELGITKEIQEATYAVVDLQNKLQQAININTGTLDLSQFNRSLKQSNTTLDQYADALATLGPTGKQAFIEIANAISTAEMPLKRTSNLLSNFAVTLKNTAKWELSSKLMHGFESAISSAYNYAQDLNKSLNDIRIVSGQSTEQMAQFAEYANKAAKSLSTTTLDYTDASLIYYQQGLTDKEVQERTEVTIKMANAAGESATKVSDQLTAVWNNFYDGSKSLEYYADVMTKLGAATASSTDEIAEGLEKFAAIADTVGLSYEYATAALATVTSNTRQSADVVGTAFKTIFARMQDLELGETLDDGTTLGTYSQALEKVGISVLDTNGNLIEMDSILDQMAAKWETLSSAQQVSLAQSVAGVRQYSQLVALMDNWDSGDADSMTANLGYVENAEGALQEQQDIYAESWEAARDRVTAALESIYQDLLNDEGFITFLNIIEKVVEAIDKIIDGLGGLNSILPLIAIGLSKLFGKELATGFDNMLYNIQTFSKKGKAAIVELKKEALQIASDMQLTGDNQSGAAIADINQMRLDLQKQLIDKTSELEFSYKEISEEEKKQAEYLLDINKSLGDQYIQLVKNKEALQDNISTSEKQAKSVFGTKKIKNFIAEDTTESDPEKRTLFEGSQGFTDLLKKAKDSAKTFGQNTKAFNTLSKAFDQVDKKAGTTSKAYQGFKDQVVRFTKAINDSGETLDEKLISHLEELNNALEEGNFDKIRDILNGISSTAEDAGGKTYEYFEIIREGAKYAGANMSKLNPILDSIQASYEQTGSLTIEQIEVLSSLGLQFDETGKIIGNFKGKIATVGDAVSGTVSALSTLSFAFNSAINAGEQLFDPDVSGIQKVISLIGVLSSALTVYKAVQEAVSTIEGAITGIRIKKNAATIADTVATGASTVATGAHAVVENLDSEAIDENTKRIKENAIATMSHPILGVIAIALMAVVGIISAITSAIERNNEAVAESAAESKEKAEALQEEIEANEKLVKTFKDTLEAYEQGTTSKEEMVEASEAVAQAYEIENQELLIQSGNYTELAKAIREAQEEKLKLAQSETLTAKNQAAEVFEDTMRDDLGHFAGGKYTANFGGWTRTAVGDGTAYSVLTELVSDLGFSMSEAQVLKTDQDTDSMLAGYEKILKIKEAIEAKANEEGYEGLLDENYYKNIVEWLEKSEESYNNLIELQNELNDLQAQEKILNIKDEYDDVTSLSEYNQIKQELVKSLQESNQSLSTEKAEELAQAALEADESFSDIAKQSKILSQASIKMDLDDKGLNELQEFYDNLTDEQKVLFATLDFKSGESVSNLEEQLEYLQARANLNSIKVGLEAVKTDQSNLKDNMTAEDYSEFYTSSGIDWGNEEQGIIEFSSFLVMSYEDQLQYLNNLQNAYEEAAEIATIEALNAAEDRLTQATNKLEEKQSDLSTLLASDEFTGLYGGEDSFYATDKELTDAILNLNNYDIDSTQYQDQLQELYDAGVTDDIINSYLRASQGVIDYTNEINNLTDAIEIYKNGTDDEEIEKILKIKAELEGAETIGDLQNTWLNLLTEAGEEGLDYTYYSDSLNRLASEYENCIEELNAFNVAVKYGTDEELAHAQAALELAIRIGELAEEFDLEADEIEDVSDAFKELAEANQDTYGLMLEDSEALADASTRYIRVNNAVLDLSSNYNDYVSVLNDVQSAETDLEKAQISNTSSAIKLKKSLADLIGTSEDFIDVDLLEAIDPDLFEQAALGDAEAIEKIRNAFIELQAAANGIDLEGLKSELNGLQEGVVIDISADESPFLNKLIQAKIDAGATAAEIESLLSGFGIDADVTPFEGSMEEMAAASAIAGQEVIANTSFSQEVTPEEVETEEKETEIAYHTTYVPHTITQPSKVLKNGADNPVTVWETRTNWIKKVEPEIVENSTTSSQTALAVNTQNAAGDSGNITGVTIANAHKTYQSASTTSTHVSNTAAANVAEQKNTGGGGGSSSNKTAENANKDDIVDRYKEINDAIDDITRATDRASKAADRLYGKSRINALKEANSLLQQEIGLLEQKKSQAESYLATDQAALNAAASAAGVSLTYDSNGNISNYTTQMTALYNQLQALIDQVNADGNVTDEEQEKIDALQELIDNLKDAISQYDDTKEMIQDLEDEITDKFYEWQDNNYEILHYELEIEIELNDLQLEYIDYYLNKLTDDFYAMAEAAQYMTNQIPIMTESLGHYENFYHDITSAYANGEISQADYVDGMKEAYSSILDQLQALNELDKEMMHYYEDTLDAAEEELSYYTDQLEHLTSVLEHYKNLVELVNGEYDYESVGKILEAQASTLKNELDVSTQYYQMLLTEKQAIEESLANATDEAARELFEEELKAITTAVNEAQEEMLSKTEEWAEVQKSIMENAMAEAASAMEKAFTDGMGFDALSNSLSRLSSYADEYLTKTNQMYETQKLINTAQQAADKSTNEAAKARLKAYQDEIEELQNKNQLSQLELEIAQAKYDVVLAEIALEEAQSAKSTVRLQRDSEGNFGYVYTSDQEQISQAEQDLADAQNALYNIGLEGANEYGQKLLELKQQLADDLIALEEARAAGQYATDEEYYAARDQLIREYNDLFLAYSEQYTTALGVDNAIQEEAWVNAYDSMINKSLDWKDKVTEYTQNCEEAYKSWREVVEEESEVVDGILNDLEQEVKDVTTESDNLKNEIVSQVIPAINNQLVSVRNVTAAYAEQRSAIQALITYYEQLVQEIYMAIAAQAALDSAMSTSSSSSSSSVDYSLDYSALMNQAWAAGDMEAYEYYKQMRDEKINAGYSNWGVETDWIDDYLNNNGSISGQYWTDIDWDKYFNGGLASGGYTGSWGPEGRIAMLHEKELVLNADDTANFLQGIDLLRNVVDMIDLKALQDQVSILPYYPGAEVMGTQEEIQQTVTIEANFPNVQDRNEIQEAFNTLINKASQYVNRKR